MASLRHPTTMEDLPREVLSDIFIRLLARQVAQMRCVSKSRNALLSDSYFVKSHLHHSLHNTNDKILLFFHGGFLLNNNSITARPTRSPDLKLTNFVKVPVNLQSKKGYCYGRVIGSVNGLICFNYVSHSLYTCDDVVYIWNPSLSAVLTLPPCSLPYTERNHFRFGYDSKTDDYKVVRLTYLDGKLKILPEVEVYSMRKGSWELITQRFPSNITLIRDDDYVCADGHDGRLHWLCYIDKKLKAQTIVAFDLGAETFREISLPHSIVHHYRYRYPVLKVLAGKLCLMSKVYGGEGVKYEVWVMDEYGKAESWVKHHVLSQFGDEMVPYGFTSHNEFLFQDYDCFGSYDPITAQAKTFKIQDVNKIVEYVDSLVWVAPTEQ